MHEIDRLNDRLEGITLLKRVEVDILGDGRLDLPDDVLGELDLVIGAVHSNVTLSRAKQTERILRAMDRPYFTILAHPTGRLLDSREPYAVDMLRIIRKAHERGCFLELNAYPERLDLLEVYCRWRMMKACSRQSVQMHTARRISRTLPTAWARHDAAGWKRRTYSTPGRSGSSGRC